MLSSRRHAIGKCENDVCRKRSCRHHGLHQAGGVFHKARHDSVLERSQAQCLPPASKLYSWVFQVREGKTFPNPLYIPCLPACFIKFINNKASHNTRTHELVEAHAKAFMIKVFPTKLKCCCRDLIEDVPVILTLFLQAHRRCGWHCCICAPWSSPRMQSSSEPCTHPAAAASAPDWLSIYSWSSHSHSKVQQSATPSETVENPIINNACEDAERRFTVQRASLHGLAALMHLAKDYIHRRMQQMINCWRVKKPETAVLLPLKRTLSNQAFRLSTVCHWVGVDMSRNPRAWAAFAPSPCGNVLVVAPVPLYMHCSGKTSTAMFVVMLTVQPLFSSLPTTKTCNKNKFSKSLTGYCPQIS